MNKTRPAYSLIFAFVIMTLIMVIASTSIQDTRNKIRLFQDLEANSQARLAAESAAELGIVDLKNSSFESGVEQEEVFCLTNSGTDCESDGNYTVYSEAAENTTEADGYYYLPIPGTGDAASTGECSISEHLDADHSCNWNKISVGDSVNIPLYYDDGSGALSFPDTINLSEFYLRMRTPCENGSLADDCDGDDRYEISSKSSTSFLETSDNPAIVLWEFVGEKLTGTEYEIPNDAASSGNRSLQENNEIYEALIDHTPWSSASGFDNTVLLGITGLGSSFTGILDLHSFINDTGYTDLYFSMSIINELEDYTSGDTVPYLEYQIVTLTNTGTPIISPTAEIIGEGYYDAGEFTYFFPYVVSSNNTDTVTTLFTLSN